MESEGPSNALLGLLALSLLLAGWVYGRPLLTGSNEFDEPEAVEPADLGFLDERTTAPVEPWTPPTNPRDPFLPVELGELPTADHTDNESHSDLETPETPD